MRLEVGGVDHQPRRLGAFARQFGEYPVEHAKPAPADEAVVDRLVRTVGLRRIAPAQAAAAWLGASMAARASGLLLSRVFSIVLIATGVAMLRSAIWP